MDHYVIVVRGKEKEEEVRKRVRRDERMAAGQSPFAVEERMPAGRSPFAVAAGHHGRMRGMPEVCVLCPRTLAYDEKSVIVVQYREVDWRRYLSSTRHLMHCIMFCSIPPATMGTKTTTPIDLGGKYLHGCQVVP